MTDFRLTKLFKHCGVSEFRFSYQRDCLFLERTKSIDKQALIRKAIQLTLPTSQIAKELTATLNHSGVSKMVVLVKVTTPKESPWQRARKHSTAFFEVRSTPPTYSGKKGACCTL